MTRNGKSYLLSLEKYRFALGNVSCQPQKLNVNLSEPQQEGSHRGLDKLDWKFRSTS